MMCLVMNNYRRPVKSL